MSPRLKNLVIALLAIVTVASGVLAWQFSRQIKALQASIAQTDAERAEWQKRTWAAEKRASTPSPAPAAEAAGSTTTEIAGNDAPAPQPERRGARPDRNAFGNLATLMENPEFAKAWTLQQKAGLDSRFAGLFKQLNLSPADLDKFKNLLVEKQSAMMDVMTAARAEGLTGRESRDELRQLVGQTQAELDESIKAAIGDVAYATYKNYEQTQPQRNLVGQLDQRLSYGGVPLSDTQSEQLVQILAATAPPRNSGAGNNAATNANFIAGAMPLVQGATGGDMRFNSGGTSITDETINRAQTVLASSQVDALRQLQAEQAAQRQIQQAMRNARNPPAVGAAPTAPAAPKAGGG